MAIVFSQWEEDILKKVLLEHYECKRRGLFNKDLPIDFRKKYLRQLQQMEIGLLKFHLELKPGLLGYQLDNQGSLISPPFDPRTQTFDGDWIKQEHDYEYDDGEEDEEDDEDDNDDGNEKAIAFGVP